MLRRPTALAWGGRSFFGKVFNTQKFIFVNYLYVYLRN